MNANVDLRLLGFLFAALLCAALAYFGAGVAARRFGESALLRRTAFVISSLPALALGVAWTLFARIRWSTGEWAYWDSSFGIAEGGLEAYDPQRHAGGFEINFQLAGLLCGLVLLSMFVLAPMFLALAKELPRLRRSAWLYGSSLALFLALWITDPANQMEWLLGS